MYGREFGDEALPEPRQHRSSSASRRRRHRQQSPSRGEGRQGSPGRSGRHAGGGSSRRRASPYRSSLHGRVEGPPTSGRFIPEVDEPTVTAPRPSGRAARSGQASDGLDGLERHYSSGQHRSPSRTRSVNRVVDHDPVPEELSSARSRRSRRVPSPGRTTRGSPRGDAASTRPGVESLQMVLLQQEESLSLAARRGAEQDAVVDGLAEQIVALNHQSSELQLRNDHLLEHQSALEDEVVHLHSELTATTDEKDRLTAQVADLDTKLQRSRSRTEELTGILEKLLGPTDSELDSAAAKIQARYRGAKTRRDMPKLPARDRRPGVSGGSSGVVANKFCTQCGSGLPAGSKFCPGCGSQV